MMRLHPFVALLPLAACYSGFETEEGQLELKPTDIFVEPTDGLRPAHPLLASTEVCVEVRCADEASDCPAEVGACFAQSVTGGAPGGPDCVVADTPGTLVWHFDPVACEATAYDPVPDRVTFQVVAPDAVDAGLQQWAELGAEASLEPQGRAFPADWIAAPGEPFRVVGGGSLRLPVVLSHPDHTHPVAWNTQASDLSVVTTSGPDADWSVPEPGWVEISPALGTEAEVHLATDATTWKAGHILGVPDAPASIELVVAYAPDEGGTRLPLGARALLRDADGKLLYGAPVRWRVTKGSLSVEPGGSDLPGHDYAALADACERPSRREKERSATLEVAHGGLTDAVVLSWLAPAEEPVDDWVPAPNCLGDSAGGCGCASAPAPLGVLPLLLVGLLARRRRGTVPLTRREGPR